MDNFKINKQLGTKWFTFYTKVRPWLACLTALTVVADFVQHQTVYTSYWWLMVYFLAVIAQPVLCIIVFVKSQGDYKNFVRFVKGVLLFETINMAYGQAVQQYINNNFNIGLALIIGSIILLLGYFLWYRLNMKYFKRRISVMENDFVPSSFDQPVSKAKFSKLGKEEEGICDLCGKSHVMVTYCAMDAECGIIYRNVCKDCQQNYSEHEFGT